MKKTLFVLFAAALLCCSCSGTKCKCTYKNNKGTEVTTVVARPDDGNCSDLESNGKLSVGGIDINTNSEIKCVPAAE